MSVARAQPDPFQKMLAWSGVLHGLLFLSMVLGSYLMPRASVLPVPSDDFFLSLGASGPVQGLGGGSPTPTPPEPEPEPEPEPPPEPEPNVVRPTLEQREQIPEPEAPVKKPPRWETPKRDSGLRGADAASAESARLKGAQPGAPGLGLGGPSGGGAFDQDFEYAYYVQQMLARIQQHWQRTAVRGTAVVVVRFTIMRDGSVRDAEVEQSSGVAILDRGAVRAVLLADPMPPLPNPYPRDQVGVHLRFTYSDNY